MTREEALKRIKMILEEATANEEAVSYVTSDDADALGMAIKALEQEPCREADDYENEISDLHNRLDIVEYDKERLREEVTTLEEKLKGLSAEPCDAISRQAAIDAMCALCNTGETLKENPWRDNPHIDAIIDALDNLPSVTPQPKMEQWIPVSQKPEKQGCYITTVDYGEYGLAAGQRYYHGEDIGWSDECVIAWMPSPKPYNPQESEAEK